MHEIKVQAQTNTRVKCSTIVDDKYILMTEQQKLKLPEKDSIKKYADRVRRGQKKQLAQPKTLLDINLPDDCKSIIIKGPDGQIISERQFLLYDSERKHKERIQIYGTWEGVEKLCRSKRWLSDGTFAKPKHFMQVSFLILKLDKT